MLCTDCIYTASHVHCQFAAGLTCDNHKAGFTWQQGAQVLIQFLQIQTEKAQEGANPPIPPQERDLDRFAPAFPGQQLWKLLPESIQPCWDINIAVCKSVNKWFLTPMTSEAGIRDWKRQTKTQLSLSLLCSFRACSAACWGRTGDKAQRSSGVQTRMRIFLSQVIFIIWTELQEPSLDCGGTKWSFGGQVCP